MRSELGTCTQEVCCCVHQTTVLSFFFLQDWEDVFPRKLRTKVDDIFQDVGVARNKWGDVLGRFPFLSQRFRKKGEPLNAVRSRRLSSCILTPSFPFSPPIPLFMTPLDLSTPQGHTTGQRLLIKKVGPWIRNLCAQQHFRLFRSLAVGDEKQDTLSQSVLPILRLDETEQPLVPLFSCLDLSGGASIDRRTAAAPLGSFCCPCILASPGSRSHRRGISTCDHLKNNSVCFCARTGRVSRKTRG